MTAHKRKEWYIVAKNKRLTNKEKQASIGVEEKGGSSEAANGFKMKSSGRVFSRDSMRGW